MIRIWQIPFLLLIVGITAIHAKRFESPKPVSWYFHPLWAAIYFIPVSLLALHLHSWWLLIAGSLDRFAWYNPILNGLRGKPFFYLGSTSINHSFFDWLESFLKKYWPYIWLVGLVGFVLIQFYI